jgi:hypothetical protein
VSSGQRPHLRHRRARLLRLAAAVAVLGALCSGEALASGPAPMPAPTHSPAPAASPTQTPSTPAATPTTTPAPTTSRSTYAAPRRSTYVAPVHTGPTAAQIAAAKAAAKAAAAKKAKLARQRRLHRLAIARRKARLHRLAVERQRRAAAAHRHQLELLAAQKAEREAQARFEQGVHDSIGGAGLSWPSSAPELGDEPQSTTAVLPASRAVAYGASGALLLLFAAVGTVRVLRRPRHTAAHL